MIRPRASLHASNTHLPDHCGGGVDWSGGLCLKEDPELFFPDKGHGAGEAKAICKRCPIKNICLEHALANHEMDGIWGGTTREERKEMRRRRKAAS